MTGAAAQADVAGSDPGAGAGARAPAGPGPSLSGQRPGRRLWGRFTGNRLAVAGMVWLAGLLVCFAVPALVATRDPVQQDVTLSRLLEAPSADHWLGTDRYGRDLYSRVVWGARPAVGAILIGLGLSAGIGIPVGLVSGWVGGRTDRAVMWIVDVVFALPLILLAMAVVAVTGTGLVPAMAAVGVLLSTRFARLTRGVTLAEREEQYVDAARVTGLSSPVILGRYIMPNVLPAVIVQAAIIAGATLLVSAVLSFIGVGSPPDSYDWGAMLNQARHDFLAAGWQIIPPAGAIVTTVVAFNLVGDGIRDAIGHTPTRQRTVRPTHRPPPAPPGGPHDPEAVLSIRDLTVTFPHRADGDPEVEILGRVSLDVGAGETLGIVGESGSGKTMTVLAALGLVPEPGRVTGGSVQFHGRDVTGFGEREWQPIRGNDIGVIFQDPVAALNPALTVGAQVGEPLMLHRHLGRRQARRRAVELLGMVQLPDPARTLDLYPHQLSGGMAQRVGIAIALACEPALLIADEPTTALDVTVQGQILDLLDDLTSGLGMTTVLITHDLGVIAETADRVAVLYAGQVVEVGTPHQLFSEPRHPYTWSLLATMPQNHRVGDQLTVITGTPPTPAAWPAGCRFHPRCPFTTSTCRRDPPPPHTDLGDGRSSRCHRIDDLTATLNPPAPPTATNPAAAPRSQP